MKMRILSIILTVCIVMSISPIAAFATPDTPGGTEPIKPVIIVQPEDCNIQIGGTAILNIVATGEKLRYQWYRLKTNAPGTLPELSALSDDETFGPYHYTGSQTDKLIISHDSSMESTYTTVKYCCVVSNEIGKAFSDVASVTLIIKTAITKQPENCDILIGGTAIFSLTAVGHKITYQWFRIENKEESKPVVLSDNTVCGAYSFKGTNTHKLEITHNPGSSVTPGFAMGQDDAFYYCVVTGSGGIAESDRVFLTLVSSLAETPQVSDGYYISVQPGEAFDLSVEASVSDGGTLTYQWSRGKGSGYSVEGILPGQTAPTYSGIASNELGTYFYFCTVTNTRNGASARAVVTFAVIVEQSGSGGGGSETPYVFPFTDVSVGSWYYFDVLIAHRAGLINGITETTFAPNNDMTIAEAVKLAACMHQLYYTGSITLQNSANPLPWYYHYVQYAMEHGIISATGYDDYNEKITRDEFVHIFFNALPESEYVMINSVADGAIPDVPMDATYADQIYTFYRAGILVGSDSMGTFRPKSNILRCEVAAILTRMFEETARKFITLS